MSTSSFVRRHINELPEDYLFTTRELLQYGSRNAVDLTLFKLVKKGVIYRVARGVFSKICPLKSPPAVLDVARAKARAFCRKLFSYPDVAAYELGLSDQKPSIDSCTESGKVIFYSDGSRTSFRTYFMHGEIEIEFRSASPRKRSLVDDRVGKYMKALWHLGPISFEQEQFIALGFNRIERRALKAQLSFAPTWMQNLFRRWRGKYRDYDLYGAPVQASPNSLWERINGILQSAKGRSGSGSVVFL